MRTVAPKLPNLHRDDPTAVAALNKLSDAVARDQGRAARLFSQLDDQGNGHLLPSQLPKLFESLVPRMKPADKRAVVAYLHVMDLNGNGVVEYRELVCALRAVPVRTPQGLLPRAPFKLRTGVAGLSTASKSVGGRGGEERERERDWERDQDGRGRRGVGGRAKSGRSSQRRRHSDSDGSDYGSRSRSRSGSSSSSGSRRMRGRSGASELPLKEFTLELREFKRELLIDEASGLVYHRPEAKGRWPLLVGYTAPSGGGGGGGGKERLHEVPSLSRLKLLEELTALVGGSGTREEYARRFAKAAKRAARERGDGSDGGGGYGSDASGGGGGGGDGLSLTPAEAVDFLRRRVKVSEAADVGAGWRLLEGCLRMMGGDGTFKAAALAKAVERLRAAQRKLSEGDEDTVAVLAKVGRAMSGSSGFRAASKACEMYEDQEVPGCVDGGRLAEFLGALVPELRDSSGKKLAAAMHLLHHCPHAPQPGSPPFRDVFVAFRAVRCRLPPPGGRGEAPMIPAGTWHPSSSSSSHHHGGTDRHRRSLSGSSMGGRSERKQWRANMDVDSEDDKVMLDLAVKSSAADVLKVRGMGAR